MQQKIETALKIIEETALTRCIVAMLNTKAENY